MLFQKFLDRNALKQDLPARVKIYPVFHIVDTMQFQEQPSNIAPPAPPRPDSFHHTQGNEYAVESILDHSQRGRGHQLLTLMTGAPQHEAEWQPARDFVDKDGTVTEFWHIYIVEKNFCRSIIDADVNSQER